MSNVRRQAEKERKKRLWEDRREQKPKEWSKVKISLTPGITNAKKAREAETLKSNDSIKTVKRKGNKSREDRDDHE